MTLRAGPTVALMLTLLLSACSEVKEPANTDDAADISSAAEYDEYEFNGTRTCATLSGRTLIGFETDGATACDVASGTAEETNGFSLPLLKDGTAGFAMVQSPAGGVSWVFVLAPSDAPATLDVRPPSSSLGETTIVAEPSNLHIVRIDSSACGSGCEVEVHVGTAKSILEVSGDLASGVVTTFQPF